VILIDANILVYAHVSSFAQHNLARVWLDQQLNASTAVGLPWPSVLAFLRLVTNPRVFEHPEPIRDAWQQVRTGLYLRRPGYRSLQSSTLICWVNFLRYLAFTVTWSPTLTLLHWRWNTG
jgi:predicted nucleic acid-binding protein